MYEILEYGLMIWGHSTDINRIFIAQKCVNAMYNVTPSDLTTKILTLPSLYIFEGANFVFCQFCMQWFFKAKSLINKTIRNPSRLVFDMVSKVNYF